MTRKYSLKALLESDDKNLPDALPEEPITVSTSEEAQVDSEALESGVTEETINNATYIEVNNIIQSEFNSISEIKSLINTINEVGGLENVKAILDEIVNETSIVVGMLNKALELVDDSHTTKVEEGEAKAEEVVSNSENINIEDTEESTKEVQKEEN